MSFILGFSFIIFLAIFTIVLWMVSKRLPPEFALTSIVVMLAGDAVLVGLWYFSLIELVEVIKQFKLGIAAAFCTSAMCRAIFFMLRGNEQFKV